MRSVIVLGGPLLILMLLLPCGAAAAPVSFVLAEAREVELAGAVDVTFPEGSAHVDAADVRGAWTATNVTGELRVLTWRTSYVGLEQQGGRYDLGDPDKETFFLRDAQLRISTGGGRMVYDLVATDGGRVGARGAASGAGKPHVLLQDQPTSVGTPIPLPSPENVEWRWSKGWTFVGDMWFNEGPAFPPWQAPEIAASGPLLFEIQGALIEFVDENGVPRTIRTGATRDAGVEQASVERWTRAILDAEVTEIALPVGVSWGVSGPAAIWSVDGEAKWTDAAGHVEISGRRHAIRETLEISGETLAQLRPSTASLTPMSSNGDASATAIRVDGRVLLSETRTFPTAQVAGVALSAVVVLGLTRGAQAALAQACAAFFYTRIARNELFVHPKRAAIHRAVTTEPGIHLRELHRRIGGGWGPFSFHLRLLEKAGEIHVRADGRFKAVFPPGRADAAFLRSPKARALLAALPGDGRALTLAQLAAAVGGSRQLVSYHLKSLEGSGLIRTYIEGGERRVARSSSDVQGVAPQIA